MFSIKNIDERTKKINKHILLSFFYNGGSILASFLLVPLSINFLDVENYGIWLAITSFLSWFSFFDIGLGNGLRNKYTEAIAKNDFTSAKGYVSTAYFSIGLMSSIVFLFFLILNYFIDWTLIFNTENDLMSDLKLLLPIIFGFFFIQLVAKLIISIRLASQEHSFQAKTHFLSTFISLIAVWILTEIDKGSLVLFGTFYSLIPVLILIMFNLISFKGKYRSTRPSWTFVKRKYFNSIFGLGIKFFLIQVAGIVLFATDNFIIIHLFSPSEVVPYTISHKYMGISLMVFNILISPFWSSITDAYIKKDLSWIKKSMRNLTIMIMLFFLLIILMVIFSQFFFFFWIGELIIIKNSLTIAMAIFFLLSIIYSPFTYFVNGVGKIRLQMILISVSAIINIPLSIFLADCLGYGVNGVILASIICILPYTIICPIQYFKIINNNATGIWNQ